MSHQLESADLSGSGKLIREVRILHILPSLDRGAAENRLLQLAGAMDRQTFPQALINLSESGLSSEAFRSLGMPVLMACLSGSSVSGLPGAISKMAAMVRNFRPHVIHSWGRRANLTAAIIRELARPGSGKPALVWTIGLDDRGIGPPASSDPPRISESSWSHRICALLSDHLPQAIMAADQESARVHARAGFSLNRMVILPDPAANLPGNLSGNPSGPWPLCRAAASYSLLCHDLAWRARAGIPGVSQGIRNLIS